MEIPLVDPEITPQQAKRLYDAIKNHLPNLVPDVIMATDFQRTHESLYGVDSREIPMPDFKDEIYFRAEAAHQLGSETITLEYVAEAEEAKIIIMESFGRGIGGHFVHRFYFVKEAAALMSRQMALQTGNRGESRRLENGELTAMLAGLAPETQLRNQDLIGASEGLAPLRLSDYNRAIETLEQLSEETLIKDI